MYGMLSEETRPVPHAVSLVQGAPALTLLVLVQRAQ
jgi:hypothetical protein